MTKTQIQTQRRAFLIRALSYQTKKHAFSAHESNAVYRTAISAADNGSSMATAYQIGKKTLQIILWEQNQ